MVTSQGKNLKDVIKEEYTRCAKDVVYFLVKYCIIQHPVRGKIPFYLWDFQKKTLGQFLANRFNIILKARQLGISTLVAGYALWLMLFHGDKKVLVIATKQGVAKNLVTKVRVMHSNLPSWLKGRCIADNKLSLEFANGSSILAEAASPEAGRSEALSLLILDECAFIDYIDTIWSAAAMTLATGGDAIVLSTPNGVGNLFYKMWQSAEEGIGFSGLSEEGEEDSKEADSDAPSFIFNPIRLHWSIHPERDQAWRDEQDKLLGKRKAAQECDCDFLTSGQTVIESTIIKWYEETRVKPPIEKRYVDHNYWIWEYPATGKTYVVAADPARGDGSDSSTFQVLDIDGLTQAAEYKGFIGTGEFGNLLVTVATEYNDALLVIENQAMGWAVIQKVVERNYKNLFYSSADMMVVDIQSQMQRSYDMRTPNNTDKIIAGITSGAKIRQMVVSKIDEYFRSQELVVYSRRLISELYTFIWLNNYPIHMPGYHDDAIFAMGYALLVKDTALKLRQRGIDLQKQALDRINTSPKIYIPNRRIVDPYELRIAGGYSEDLRWLIGTGKDVQPQNISPEERKKLEEEERKKSVGTPCPPTIG